MSGVVCCESAGLSAKVQEDGIGFPVAQGADGGLIDAGYEESGGSSGSEAVGDDSVRRDVSDVLNCGSCCTESSGDVARGDVMGPAPFVKVAVQGTGWLCLVVA